MSIRIAIVGYGRMGKAVEGLALERGWTISSIFDKGSSPINPESLAGAQVAIEFSEPGSAAENVAALLQARCPVVVGTTGWLESMQKLRDQVAAVDGALLWAPNFSLGAQLQVAAASAAASAARTLGEFSPHITETHHSAKKDAPSGTAIALQHAVEAALGSDVPVTSIRVGSVPGTHEVLFDGAFEQIRIVHTVRDRRVFAAGALTAAQWLIGRRGVYSLADMLQGDQS